MSSQFQRTISTILGIAGVLFFIAPSFDILPRNIGNFLGIASFLVSGALFAVPKKEEAAGPDGGARDPGGERDPMEGWPTVVDEPVEEKHKE